MAHDFSLTEGNALIASHAPPRRSEAACLLEAPQPQPDNIRVEVASGQRLHAIVADWRDLITRADVPNIFMHPALVHLASQVYRSRALALLAWQQQSSGEQLVGLWAFVCGRAPQSVLPGKVLVAPAMPNAYLATPVIDRTCLDGTLAAMLDRIATDAALPKIIALEAMTIDGPTMQALARILAARGSPARIFSRTQRPKLASSLDGTRYLEQALSKGTRKKLRQQRRRLEERGALEFRVISEPGAVKAAFEGFLAAEAAAWKGRLGTAVTSNAANAAFARAMIAMLADQGEAEIHLLALDGRPVSLQVVLRGGPAAYTWKTTYDEALRDYSPGMLLFEDYTTALLADDRVAYVDSCTFDDTGFMAAWRERQAIANMWIDVRRGSSPVFAALSHAQKGYLVCRTAAKKIYRSALRRRMSKKS